MPLDRDSVGGVDVGFDVGKDALMAAFDPDGTKPRMETASSA